MNRFDREGQAIRNLQPTRCAVINITAECNVGVSGLAQLICVADDAI